MPLLVAMPDDLLTRTLFQSPGWAILVFAVVWALMRILGRRTENRRVMLASWLPLLLVGGLIACDWSVTTRREQLPQAVVDLLLAVEEKDAPRFRELVLPEAMTSIFKKELSRDEVEAMVNQAKIADLMVTSSSLHLEEDQDTAMTMILVRADGSVNNAPGIEISEWAIRWRYVDGQWRALRLECTAIGAQAIFGRE